MNESRMDLYYMEHTLGKAVSLGMLQGLEATSYVKHLARFLGYARSPSDVSSPFHFQVCMSSLRFKTPERSRFSRGSPPPSPAPIQIVIFLEQQLVWCHEQLNASPGLWMRLAMTIKYA